MTYLQLADKLRKGYLREHPGCGTRTIAADFGVGRDTARRALAVVNRGCEVLNSERIGFYDIEASNLKANFGIVLTYCIKPLDGEVLKRSITARELRNGSFDRRLTAQFCADARQFDRLVGYYSSRYDMPFLRTRSLLWGHHFPVYREVSHTDVYFMVRNRLNLHSRRLQAVCEFFDIPAKEHRLDPNVWLRCLSGDKKALDHVLAHNIEDVVSLEAVWKKIAAYSQPRNTSI